MKVQSQIKPWQYGYKYEFNILQQIFVTFTGDIMLLWRGGCCGVRKSWQLGERHVIKGGTERRAVMFDIGPSGVFPN